MNRTAIFKDPHFTTSCELIILEDENVVDSYLISTQEKVEEVIWKLLQNNVNRIIFYGNTGLFKDIEKAYNYNKPEVQILWQ